MQYWLWTGAALAAGLLLRLWFVRHLALIAGDSLVYGDIAKNWLQHGIYGFTEPGLQPGSIQIRPTLIRLPGYPFFLAVCFCIFGMENYTAVLYAQTAADLVTCCLAAAIAKRLFGPRAALIGRSSSPPSPPPSTPSPAGTPQVADTMAGSGSPPQPSPLPSCCVPSKSSSPHPRSLACSGQPYAVAQPHSAPPNPCVRSSPQRSAFCFH